MIYSSFNIKRLETYGFGEANLLINLCNPRNLRLKYELNYAKQTQFAGYSHERKLFLYKVL